MTPEDELELGQLEKKAKKKIVSDLNRPHALIGSSMIMIDLRAVLDQVAQNDSTVLITGETGSGKEAAVSYVHEKFNGSGRLMLIDCAALSDSMAEAELFGHTRGAFTNANYERTGLFNEAQNGVAFFDEVGEIPLAMQPKFLRLIEDKAVRQIGSNRFSRVNAKIIACTNRDLEAEVNAGRFRQDLLNRLKVISIEMPPLRAHREDIPEIVHHMLSQSIGVGITNEALEFLKQQTWPDNVRQLRNSLERAATFCQNKATGVLTLEQGDFAFFEKRSIVALKDIPDNHPRVALARQILEHDLTLWELEYLYFSSFVQRGLSQKKIAEILGLKRTTYLEKFKRLGLLNVDSDLPRPELTRLETARQPVAFELEPPFGGDLPLAEVRRRTEYPYFKHLRFDRCLTDEQIAQTIKRSRDATWDLLKKHGLSLNQAAELHEQPDAGLDLARLGIELSEVNSLDALLNYVEYLYLKFLKVDRNLNCVQVSKIIGYTYNGTFAALRRNGLPTISRENPREAVTDDPSLPQSEQPKSERALLEDLFVKRKLRPIHIQKIMGVTGQGLRNKLYKYGFAKPDEKHVKMGQKAHLRKVLRQSESLTEVLDDLRCNRRELIVKCQEHGLSEMLNRFFEEN